MARAIGENKMRKMEREAGQWTDSLRQTKSTHCYSTHLNMLFPQISHGFLVHSALWSLKRTSAVIHMFIITPITCFIFKTT